MKYCIIAFMFLFSFIEAKKSWPYIPFDRAMQKNNFNFDSLAEITRKIMGVDGNILYNFFKNNFEKNCHLEAQEKPIIPLTIHRIWLGSPEPEAFKPLLQSWLQYHMNRGWQYKLWTDADVTQLQLYNQEFYDATDNPGVKSDILRYEILYRFGGIYIDVDYECLAPFDDLHYTYDFYTGLQPLDSSFIQLGNALIGSCPGHPILKHCIETIKNDWHEKGAPKKTGPVHFTKSFYACANQDDNNDIVFPAFYFCPLGCRERNNNNKDEWQKQGAFAIHWWAKSWMPKEYRPSLSKNIDNDGSAKSWND